ncbi:MAG: FAD-dependent oxidoreductase [Clostridia bacterium]|nr:FAD-dependent oxidoreductase [Clostridia bacterium]
MSKITLKVNGKSIEAEQGANLLKVLLDAGIDVPHLCFDKKVSSAGECGMCVAVINGGAPVKLCQSVAEEGLVIETESEELTELRKEALKKLIALHRGDCIAPCKKACPAGSDCQGYAALIAEGRYSDAIRLLKDYYPLPASLGRVCPHPCEAACRRGLLEAPVSLAGLKRFAGDLDLASAKQFLPAKAAPTGKKVAIIGGGPAGLTAAWFLARAGHMVTILEAQEKAGGMLRYGIPEFRLPKAVLDREIEIVEAMGVEIRTNTKVEDQAAFEALRKEYDAVMLAIGAWKASPMRIPGEDCKGVVNSIDFLLAAGKGERPNLGKRVAVVGGGNSAIDACRTAIRLEETEEVVLLYRRTRDEMPAFEEEVAEAEAEGVKLQFLVAPLSAESAADGVHFTLQKMQLGEPDASGRRRPEPIEGAVETVVFDTVISAIGQKIDADKLGVGLHKWGTIVANEDFSTNLPGVYAAGDAINDGPDIAVQAIGDAHKAADAIDAYLKGEAYVPACTNYAEQELTKEDLAYAEPAERQVAASLPHSECHKNFKECAQTFTEEQAKAEAARCLECGCLDLYECSLLKYAQEFGVALSEGSTEPHTDVDRRHPYIYKDHNKCIHCGSCVRVCQEVMGAGAWVKKEDGSVVTATGDALQTTYCVGCGQCVEICPTGALTEHNPRLKPLVVKPEKHCSVCNYCGVGCSTVVHSYGNAPIKVTPCHGGSLEDNILCRHGRFGWHTAMGDRTLTMPMSKQNGEFVPCDWASANAGIKAKIQEIQAKYGKDSIGVVVADRMTSEEIYMSTKLAEAIGTKNVYSANIYNGGLEDVFGIDGSTNSYQELENADAIFILGADVPSYYAMLAIPVQRAVQKGAKLLLAAADGWNGFNMLASRRAVIEDDTRFLKEMIKALIDMGCKPENANGFDELAESVKDVVVSEEARLFAEDYKNAKNAMIMLDRERVSLETARLLSDISVVAGQIGRPSTGLIQMLQHNNTQSISYMNIRRKMPHLVEDIKAGKIKGLVLVEQFIDAEVAKELEYVLLFDSAKGPAFEYATDFLPMPGYGAYDGTYISGEGRVQKLRHVFDPVAGKDGWQVLSELIAEFGGKPFASVDEIDAAIAADFAHLRNSFAGDDTFVGGSAVRFENGFCHEDGKAQLMPAKEKAPMFGSMVFADVPLTVWFGQLIGEGLLQY